MDALSHIVIYVGSSLFGIELLFRFAWKRRDLVCFLCLDFLFCQCPVRSEHFPLFVRICDHAARDLLPPSELVR